MKQEIQKYNVVAEKITGWRYLNKVEEVGNNWGVLLRREKSGHNNKMVLLIVHEIKVVILRGFN